jgi:hypothetical protein
VILEFIKFNRYINLRHSLVVLSVFSDKHYLLYYDVGQERVKRKRKEYVDMSINIIVLLNTCQNRTKQKKHGGAKEKKVVINLLLEGQNFKCVYTTLRFYVF